MAKMISKRSSDMVYGVITQGTGINFQRPHSNWRFDGKNGEVKVTKPADPEKLAQLRSMKKGRR